MGETNLKVKDKKKKKQEESLNNTIVQFFEIVYVVLMLFLIFANELIPFNGHVLQSTIAWMLSMVQGLLVFRGVNAIFRRFLGKDQVFIHWVMETIALVGASLGLINAYFVKVQENKGHFLTWHSVIGIIGYSLCILSGLNGIPTLYRKELKNYISPKWLKFIHILTGTLGFGFGGLSLILASYTNWFLSRTSFSMVTFIISISLVCVVFVWTIIRPIEKVRSNWNKITDKSDKKNS